MFSSYSFPSSNILLLTKSKSLNIRSSTRTCAMATTASPSPYDVLGLSKAANYSDIKAAYRKLVLSCHPDVCKQPDASPDEFMKIHDAYSTLSDPDKRADYDRGNSFGRLSYVRSRSANYGARRRTWETDQCW